MHYSKHLSVHYNKEDLPTAGGDMGAGGGGKGGPIGVFRAIIIYHHTSGKTDRLFNFCLDPINIYLVFVMSRVNLLAMSQRFIFDKS